MKDEERYYVATLQKNAGATSRSSQQYLAEKLFFIQLTRKSSELIFFADPLNISTVGQYFFLAN